MTKLLIHLLKSVACLDTPNARSAHTIPTPRGGGLSFVCLSLVALFYYLPASQFKSLWYLALGGIALIGLIDDFKSLSACIRLGAHMLAALLLVISIGPITTLDISILHIDLSLLAYPCSVLFLVWCLNLYNFMDGIDGIAGFEAISSLFFMSVLLISFRLPLSLIALHCIVAAAILGFWLWNIAPARIFMGDVGSGFLGLLLGAFILLDYTYHPELFWCWLIILGAFIVDATYTLLRRFIAGESLLEAHSSHAYQHAARYYQSHSKVVLRLAFINIFWLMPIGWFVAQGVLSGILGLIMAYMPLLFLAQFFKAGNLSGPIYLTQGKVQ